MPMPMPMPLPMPLPKWTCALRDDAAIDRVLAGGKAVGLAKLVRAGLPVPGGFVVLASAMDAVLDGVVPAAGPWSDATVRTEAARLGDAARTRAFPAGLDDEIRRALAALAVPGSGSGSGSESGAVAVRSSAIDEDARERSAAGQFETITGVRGDTEVIAAVRACWASVHAHRVAVYRARTGKPPFGARAAVVVQNMAPADVSGVVFTRDPIRARGKHLVVEAAPGSGGVVGGGSVERWELGRGKSGDGAIGEILGGGGAGTLLDDSALRELGRLALAGEAALGVAADLEFAWSKHDGFSLLQLRPVTAPRRVRARTRGIVWTQRFSGERWIEPVTPLGWSLIEPALARFTHWEWASRRYLRGTRIARLHAGLPFFNVTIFRHLLFKMPGTPTPEFVLEMFPPEEAAELRRRRWLFPTPGLVALVIAEACFRSRWRGHRWLWFTNPTDWERLATRILAEARATDLRRASGADALAEIARLRPWIDRYVGIHLWSLLWANLFYQVLGVLLERWGGRDLHVLRPALLVGGAGENFTVRANLAIAELAESAQRDAALAARLARVPDGAAALRELRADPSPAAASLRESLAKLLHDFGHRARSTWEVFSPRWRDEPELVIEMMRASLRAGARAREREESLRIARADAEATLTAKLRGVRGAIVARVLANARVFSHLRENQRFVFDELLLAVRDAALVLGDRLASDGLLVRATDVTHLTIDEARELHDGTLSAAEAQRRISARRAEIASARTAVPPTFLFEHEDGRTRVAANGPVLVGLGISPGSARGRVRIARTLDDASRLQPGEVLVAKATDPGWTPYFPSAAGLVTELGGRLSHAAVVAREYGLPAVANVADATRLLCDGEEVVIDGDAGTVRRLR